jgi:SAM-dependent methyltransferase
MSGKVYNFHNCVSIRCGKVKPLPTPILQVEERSVILRRETGHPDATKESEMKSWHESDDFWETMAPMIFGNQRWDAAPVEVDQVVRLLGASPGAAILDLCCGPGRHSLELARRGFNVTGVDRTAVYIERAQEQAEAEGLAVEFVQEDMRHFCRPNVFDAAISLFTSFGYFEDPDENHQVLTNMYHSLKDEGTLILEMMGKEVLARIFRERDWSEQDGVLFLEERKVSKDWSWMENRWIMLRGQERHEFEISHWLYSAAELSAMLKECGFGSVGVYGDLEGAPYDHRARRLVAVAYK